MEELDKQEIKEQKKEECKKTLKTVVASVICTLLFVIILLLGVLLGLKKCGRTSDNNEISSSETPTEEPIDIERNSKINNVFLEMVNAKITIDGYSDTLTNIVAVTYVDLYPNTFNIAITAISNNKVYYYTCDNYTYQGDKTTYSDFLSYLLTTGIDLRMPYGIVDLYPLQMINTFKDSNKYYVTSKNPSDENFLYGFYKNSNSNEFNVYQKRLYSEGEDAFSKQPDLVIKPNNILHNYYRGLLMDH